MKRQTAHPGVEALANFRAGLEEGIRGRRIAAHVARCERCAQLSGQLSAVTWALASVPLPSLPDAVERRIGAAIAAEATGRQVASLTAGSRADSSAVASLVLASTEPTGPAAAEPRHARRWSPRRALGPVGPRLRLSPVQMLVPVAACLLLAGLGYLLSVPGRSGVPSSAGQAPARSVSASEKGPDSRGPRRAISPTIAIGPAAEGNGAAFLVTVSSTRYRKPTLGAQVSSQLARQALVPNVGQAPISNGTPGSESNENSPGNQAGSSASRSDTTLIPSRSLVGCVMHLTRDVPPAFVQLATYQGEPAYVIAVPGQAWVVRLSCTAARPALITSVALAAAA
jgi:hypothetical protein